VLRHYLEGGGGAAFLMGEHVDLRNYNQRLLTPVAGITLGNVQGVQGEEGGYFSLGRVDAGHPLLEGVFRSGEVNIRSPRFIKIVEILGTDFLTIFTLGEGRPLLVEKQVEGGTVFILSTGLPASWSDLSVSTLFAPLIFRSAVYLSAPRLEEKGSHHVGESLSFTADIGNITSSYFVTSPAGERSRIRPEIQGDRMVLTHAFPAEAGVYRFYENENLLGMRAVNTDPRESDLSVIPEGELKDMFSDGRVSVIEENADLERIVFRTRWGREFWREMILLALIILVVETIVARAGKKTWTEETEP
jgi:hypothetical protein